MTYAFLLLAGLAIVTWAVMGGLHLPSLEASAVDTSGLNDRAQSALNALNEMIRSSIRSAVRDQLHEAVDDALSEQ